jgi:hypothetical protein
MIKWLRRIISPCVFGHEPRVYERDQAGVLVLVCPRCRDAHRVRFAVR